MKEYIFDEKAAVEQMQKKGMVDDVNINKTIKKLARYNYYIRGMNEEESYNFIVQYMNDNYPYFSEVGSYNDIKGCIKDAPKGAWKDIQQVIITKAELDIIASLNDIRQEKLAFVLLADAKYDNAYKRKSINLSYLNNSDLYRLARVTMPIKERSMFLHFLYEHNLVEININPMTTHKKLLYVDESDSDVGIVLTEKNYEELAFTYLNWKSGGYKECCGCGRLFKTKEKGNQLYCKKCTPKYSPMEVKTIVCQDCHKEVDVDAKYNNGCRCPDCQHEALKERWKAASKKYRDSKKTS